jgi:glyoxylase-like metal-dependent hydrolase (beta-lactamase superfamily II)
MAGRHEVLALLDAAGPFPAAPGEAFPSATAGDWARARLLDRSAFGSAAEWRLAVHCFAVRRPDGATMLVDTGVGPEPNLVRTPGRLLQRLAEHGIQPDAVEVVVLTHLHEDHVGWAVGQDGAPTFRNARYVVQWVEAARIRAEGDSPVRDTVVEPLQAAGQLELISGRRQLSRGRGEPETIMAVPTPGHTVGHQSVLVDAPGAAVVITGDVLVHAVQLVNPDVAYVHESDPAVARRTRRALIERARQRGTVLAIAHLTEPFTSVVASP